MNKLLLKTEEAAEMLGLSKRTMYDLLMSGAVRSVKIRGSRRVPSAALEEYVAWLTSSDGAR